MKLLVAEDWRDYELLDAGEGEKLERWGQYVIARPEPRAIWKKGDKNLWKKADAVYGGSEWNFRNKPPEMWTISYRDIKFKLKPTEFKHTGVFPEQAANWDWISERCRMNMKVLNLFGYTGGSTMAAALAGATVTHVDASRPAMMWASENAQEASVPKDRIRWIQEDALKFVLREIRRGSKYDGIIMDPPRFGRGAGGEIWKLEEKLPELLEASRQILSESPVFFLVNAYTADLSSIALGNLVEDVLGREVENGELGLKQTSNGKIMPAGIWARWSS